MLPREPSWQKPAEQLAAKLNNAAEALEAEREIDAVTEANFDLADVARLAEADLNFLAPLAMPTVFEYAWPYMFLAAWNLITGKAKLMRDFSKLALCLPRGFGKSTFVKLIVLWCILFTKKQFILILAETATKAEAIIADIIDMLDEQNIRNAFGSWRVAIEKDTGPLKKFGFRGRNIIIAGLGAGGSVRGLNVKNARPDVMVFDDIQSREEADSEMVSKGLMRWMIGTAMKAKSPKGCLYLFVANMYPTPHSLMRKLLKNSQWTKFKTGGIVQDGKGKFHSIWEDLQPLNQLLDEYRADEEAGHPEIFQAEVLNDENASVNTYVDFDKLLEFPYAEEDGIDIHAGNFVVIDPATGKANADAVSCGYFQVHDGKSVLWDLEEGRMSPKESIRSALRLCMKYNCRIIFVEGVAYQSTLCYWFGYVMRELGITGIQVVDIYPGKTSKTTRILTMFKQLQEHETYVHPQCRNPVFAQIRGFNALRADNVDGLLDLLCYAPLILTTHSEYLKNNTVIEMQDSNVIRQYTEVENSAF